jgi:hypothetical protein
MTTPQDSDRVATLLPSDGLGPFHVGQTAYDQFVAGLDLQIEQLVSRWQSLAAPGAGQPSRGKSGANWQRK